MLRYSSYDIVLQEIPNEVSLSFTITGCGLRCIGCHSEYLWDKNNGEVLTDELFVSLIKKYEGMISCVLFMGGVSALFLCAHVIQWLHECEDFRCWAKGSTGTVEGDREKVFLPSRERACLPKTL